MTSIDLEATNPAETITQYLTILEDMMGSRIVQKGLLSPHRFMLDHGRLFAKSERTYAGRRMEAKMCYRNATNRVLKSYDLIYVEGYTTVVGIPIPHAWAITPGGEVIDPTLKDDDPEHGGRAFFGLAFSREYLRQTVLAKGTFGLLDGMSPTLHDIVQGKTDGMLEPLELK